VIEGQYFIAPISALWLFSASAIMELPRAMEPINWRRAVATLHADPMLFLSSAALGFGVNICTFLVIKSTNSVTLKVLGTARNAGLVLVASWMYNEHITRLEATGYGISLLAFGAYNYYKLYGL
jgi:hypothetical protein